MLIGYRFTLLSKLGCPATAAEAWPPGAHPSWLQAGARRAPTNFHPMQGTRGSKRCNIFAWRPWHQRWPLQPASPRPVPLPPTCPVFTWPCRPPECPAKALPPIGDALPPTRMSCECPATHQNAPRGPCHPLRMPCECPSRMSCVPTRMPCECPATHQNAVPYHREPHSLCLPPRVAAAHSQLPPAPRAR